jgi:hypothetical protein
MIKMVHCFFMNELQARMESSSKVGQPAPPPILVSGCSKATIEDGQGFIQPNVLILRFLSLGHKSLLFITFHYGNVRSITSKSTITC